MVQKLSSVHRDLLGFHRALRLHKAVLASLGIACEEFFGKEFRHYTDNIVGEYYKVEELLEDQKEVLNDLRSTNDSLLTTKTNEIMKVLTITTFSLLPASLLGQIFSMNTEYIPLMKQPNGFWVVLGIMIGIMTFTFLFFRSKKWL
jgi:magnesium transporter